MKQNDAKVTVCADVMEGLEAVRRSGKTNMLDAPVVVNLAFEMGFPKAAFWVAKHRDLYAQGVFVGFQILNEKEGDDGECVDK